MDHLGAAAYWLLKVKNNVYISTSLTYNFIRTNNNMATPPPDSTPPIELSYNASIHLSKSNQAKNDLLSKIDLYLQELKNGEDNQDKLQILILRKKLISKYGLSVERIDNLERIFLHYCSHIFKTGKHMTFERLEYEKNHLTMDRFFVFLKDFGLTSAEIEGTSREILEKTDLVLLFKKISVNCKDVDFEQFISCLERIGILYYDSKTGFKEKQEKLALQRKKRKQAYLQSLKRKQALLDAHNKKNEDHQDKLTSQENKHQDDIEGEGQQNEEVAENDKIVTEMMNNKDLEHPEEQLKGEGEQHEEKGGDEVGEEKNNEEEVDQVEEPLVELPKKVDLNREQLLILTPEQKIQYFYQLINVDNAVTFKKKMRELNLPIFQTKGHSRRATSQVQINHKETNVRESRMPEITPEEKQRLEELRMVIEERKERDRNHGPYISKEDYTQRRKKRKIEEQQILVKRLPRQKKVEVTDLETDLSSLSKMEFDKINFRKFNPQKLIQSSQEDDTYLEQYYSVRHPQRSERRIMSTLQTTDKNSQLLLDKLKRRAQQIQTREKLEQSKYTATQEVNSSTDHQLRKNRLVQKLLKLQKV